MEKNTTERGAIIPALAEVFRAHGFEGASLARLCAGTGLGKGSLYHFFPGGKEEMASAVLGEIDGWFHQYVFGPLAADANATAALALMFDAVARYFLQGRKVCLVGLFALGHERDRFSAAVNAYFAAWSDALCIALLRIGRSPAEARTEAEDILIAIQGGLVLARAWEQPAVFMRALERLRQNVLGMAPR